MLEIRGLNKSFGGLQAVTGLNMEVSQGQIVGLIGPNGAGKTTVFNVISGHLRPSGGKVFLGGEEVTGLPAYRMAKKGMSRTFQSNAVFTQDTVLGNVMAGCHIQVKAGILRGIFNTRYARTEEQRALQRSVEIIEYMGLLPVKDEIAKNLPHGLQRALGICIALASGPELLLLDEPMTGMNPTETLAMMKLIQGLQDRGITIVIVEHDMRAVMGLCQRIVVLSYGEKIAEGTPDEIRANKHVIEAYLGTEEDATQH